MRRPYGLSEEHFAVLSYIAKAENRSLANVLDCILVIGLREYHRRSHLRLIPETPASSAS